MIRFDPYAILPPPGEWEYVVHDRAIRRCDPWSARLLLPSSPAVRLGPDTGFRQWRNEYVLLHEEGDDPVLNVHGTLFVTAHRYGADLLDFRAQIREPRGDLDVTIIAPGDCEKAALWKVRKAVDWYRLELDRRDKGLRPLLTAVELWAKAPPDRLAS